MSVLDGSLVRNAGNASPSTRQASWLAAVTAWIGYRLAVRLTPRAAADEHGLFFISVRHWTLVLLVFGIAFFFVVTQ